MALLRPPPLTLAVLRRLGSLAVAAALGGCAGLPAMPPRVATTAIVDTASTRLGELERSSLAGAEAGQSGFRLLQTGDYAFDARLAIMRRAERSIDAQYYQIQKDGTGLKFLAELRSAARRGVRVRLLVDDLYTAGEDELFAALAAAPNVEVRLFNPLPARGRTLYGRLLFSLHEFTRINHRMHNKLLVADNRFAVSGGRNIADEYFMRSAAANFIDMDVISAGPIVRELSSSFDRYWNSGYAWPVQAVAREFFADGPAAERWFDERVAASALDGVTATSDALGRASVEFELASGRIPLAIAPARFFADAPEKIVNTSRDPSVSTVSRSVLALLTEARSEVIIASPYFVPGKVGMAAMQSAVAQGVKVTIFTNSLGATDEPLVHFGYARYRRDMLRMGVQIHELSPDLSRAAGSFGDFGKSFGRLHAKVVVVDRRRLIVGSLNLDGRSAWSNTESVLVIDSPALADGVHALVDRDRNASIYRLRLAADNETIEWVATGADGQEIVLTDEPHSHWLLRLKMFLLAPFASEELL